MRFVDYSTFYEDFHHVSPEYAARHARELGFDAVEFLEIVPLRKTSPLFRYSAGEIREILEAQGLTVSCFSVAVDLCRATREVMETMDFLITYAAALGSPRFHHTLVPGLSRADVTEPYESVFEAVYPNAVRIANLCCANGMVCLYEPQGLYFNGVEGLGRFYERIRLECSNVGICGDVANGLFADTPVNEIYDRFIGDIKHVHIKDYRMSDAPEGISKALMSAGGKYLYECPIGTGVTDFFYCFEKLKAAGYDGDISFEFASEDPEVRRAMEFVRRLLGKE